MGVTSTDPLSRFHAVIPAAWVGTRLWPLSRADAPKFLHDLTGSGTTLIRSTYERLSPLAKDRVMVVTGLKHAEAVTRQIPELQSNDLVLEPEPKDSAAAIGLAAAILAQRDPNIIMGSFAADQVIAPVDDFQDAVREAVTTAATGKIVTIGIKPTHPQQASDTSVRDPPTQWREPLTPTMWRNSWRSPSSISPMSTSPPGTTSGTPACLWRRSVCCCST